MLAFIFHLQYCTKRLIWQEEKVDLLVHPGLKPVGELVPAGHGNSPPRT